MRRKRTYFGRTARRKKKVVLDHEQKRQLAKAVVAGAMVKQAAAEWGISLDSAHKVIQEYTVVARYEKFPDEVAT
jgi:FixJ family two-component response regulator